MGGKDVIYLKQQHSSTLQPADVQKKLKEMADRRFLDANGHYSIASDQVFPDDKVCEEFWAQGPIFIYPAMYIFCYFMKTSEYGSLRLDGSEIWLSLLLYFALIFHAFNVSTKAHCPVYILIKHCQNKRKDICMNYEVYYNLGH